MSEQEGYNPEEAEDLQLSSGKELSQIESETNPNTEDQAEEAEIKVLDESLDDLASLRTYFNANEMDELVGRVQHDNEQAKQELIDKFSPVIERIVERRVKPEIIKIGHLSEEDPDFSSYMETIEDIKQEARLAILEKAQDYNTNNQDLYFYRGAYVRMVSRMIGYLYSNIGVAKLPNEAGIEINRSQRGISADAEKDQYQWREMEYRPVYGPAWLYVLDNILNPLYLDNPQDRQSAEQSHLASQPSGMYRSPLEKDVSDRVTQETIKKAINGLDDKERQVINMRFGLADGNNYTTEEVGKSLETSKINVTSLEISGLRNLKIKLRNSGINPRQKE